MPIRRQRLNIVSAWPQRSERISVSNSAGGPWDAKTRDGPLPERTGGTVSLIIISGIGCAPTCSPVRQVGSGNGKKSMAAAVFSALRHCRSRIQLVGMSSTHCINTGAAETGACVLIEQNWGKTCCIFACRHSYPGAGGTCGVRPCSWCSSSPDHLLFKTLSKPRWESIDREDFGTESMVEDWRLCLEDVQG
ncbi:hypothetical protein GWK47_015100 [Chionoecetes opilio]|uniref:Uncharacterized protein n=1 Tax=Chionoecetes opilio TaxID=41210 RepID=A0A8J4XVL1_CHIOP|nr:hypothetical protein GWK47_015100 [Chionoecetes opilio]